MVRIAFLAAIVFSMFLVGTVDASQTRAARQEAQGARKGPVSKLIVNAPMSRLPSDGERPPTGPAPNAAATLRGLSSSRSVEMKSRILLRPIW